VTGLEVRPATPADHDAIIDLILELNRFENAISGDRTTDRASAARRLGDHLAMRRDTPDSAIMVAAQAGRVVGYLIFLPETRPGFVREEARRVGYVSELCVAVDRRGEGIGGALLAEAERLTRTLGLSHIGLTALVGNDNAAAAYRRHGYRDYAIEMLKPLRGAPVIPASEA
jgi:ribosomal protein S18 acetylase RimI-like enzyme